MVISSTSPNVDGLPQTSHVPQAEAAQRRQLIEAGKTVNESGSLGKNQIVFSVDRATHRPIIRIEDRVTHEVILQLPAEYLLRLAADIHSDSAQVTSLSADM
jgi:uncharacterized FlaG/YvyC family protein